VQANIKGLVNRLELSQAKAMMPLYEAISNAVDAIEEHQDGFINHSIRIRLLASNDLAHQGGDGTLVVDGFDVIDDGVDFNDKNLASFKEAHTLSKVNLGGRGVGRFTFLKVSWRCCGSPPEAGSPQSRQIQAMRLRAACLALLDAPTNKRQARGL